MKYFVRFLVFLIVLAACEGEKFVQPEDGAAYFPLQKGIFQVYSVHEVRYSASEDPIVFDYELKAEVVDSFHSGTHDYTYVIHRSTRQTPAAGWEPLDTWSVRKLRGEIVVSEGNVAYIKLKFPLGNDDVWDGNTFNSMGRDDYALRDVQQPAEVNGITFDKTVTVEQELNEDRIVFRDERREIYARDVGLVYREVVQLHYCTDDACLGQQHIEEGTEMLMAIKEYGKR